MSCDDTPFFPRRSTATPRKAKGARTGAPEGYGSGGRIRTCDLRVMSPTSYRTAPPRDVRQGSLDEQAGHCKGSGQVSSLVVAYRFWAAVRYTRGTRDQAALPWRVREATGSSIKRRPRLVCASARGRAARGRGARLPGRGRGDPQPHLRRDQRGRSAGSGARGARRDRAPRRQARTLRGGVQRGTCPARRAERGARQGARRSAGGRDAAHGGAGHPERTDDADVQDRPPEPARRPARLR